MDRGRHAQPPDRVAATRLERRTERWYDPARDTRARRLEDWVYSMSYDCEWVLIVLSSTMLSLWHLEFSKS